MTIDGVGTNSAILIKLLPALMHEYLKQENREQQVLENQVQAKAYVEKIKAILEYLEVSDCKMQEGSLRADVNVSIRPRGETKFGTRTEMKNIGSYTIGSNRY